MIIGNGNTEWSADKMELLKDKLLRPLCCYGD